MQDPFSPTPEQSAIYSATQSSSSSLMISAGAGCGKTTTMTAAANRLPRAKPGLALAFNKIIATELQKRFPSQFQVRTLNGLGHSAWGKTIGRHPVPEDRKIGQLVTATAKEFGTTLSRDDWSAVRELVDSARNVGLTPEGMGGSGLIEDTSASWKDLLATMWASPGPQLIPIAREVLRRSVAMAFDGQIDFTDQIYMSALFGGRFQPWPIVMVDEAQDLSPLNHLQLKRSLTPDGRLIVVGDPLQAIYAWRGADSRSMENLRDLRSSWIDLPLQTTFRCPKLVVARQAAHAPTFRAADSAPDGEILNWHQEKKGWTASQLPPGSAVLCRNNAPLLSLAFKLISAGRGVKMLGRDIGKGLEALSRKISPEDSTPILAFLEALSDWNQTEYSKAMAEGREAAADSIQDRTDCLRATAGIGVNSVGDLRARLQALFSRESSDITLGSIHRAKGLEWSWVLHLDPWRIPAKYAQGAALAQEANLKYVCETRTRHTLTLADMERFEG